MTAALKKNYAGLEILIQEVHNAAKLATNDVSQQFNLIKELFCKKSRTSKNLNLFGISLNVRDNLFTTGLLIMEANLIAKNISENKAEQDEAFFEITEVKNSLITIASQDNYFFVQTIIHKMAECVNDHSRFIRYIQEASKSKELGEREKNALQSALEEMQEKYLKQASTSPLGSTSRARSAKTLQDQDKLLHKKP